MTPPHPVARLPPGHLMPRGRGSCQAGGPESLQPRRRTCWFAGAQSILSPYALEPPNEVLTPTRSLLSSEQQSQGIHQGGSGLITSAKRVASN